SARPPAGSAPAAPPSCSAASSCSVSCCLPSAEPDLAARSVHFSERPRVSARADHVGPPVRVRRGGAQHRGVVLPEAVARDPAFVRAGGGVVVAQPLLEQVTG